MPYKDICRPSTTTFQKPKAQQDQHLSLFISTVDKRFDTIMPAVQENHQNAVALSDLAYRSLDALDNDFVILSQLILKQTNASAQLGKELEHIKLGIHDRVKGKLSSFILPKAALQSSIRQVQDIISDKVPQFYLSHTDPLYYYSLGDFIFIRLLSQLYLTLKVPISPFFHPVSLNKVYSYPDPINSSSPCPQLMDTPEYFLIIERINITPQFHLTTYMYLIYSLFFNQKEDTPNLCDFCF